MSYSSLGECLSVGVKAHVLYSRLLSADDYWSLLGSDTVGEIADKLRSREGYRESLSKLPQEVHRYDLEAAIKTSLLEQAKTFLIHFSNPRDGFFRAWVAWYEAENLKSIFRHVAAGRVDRDELRRRLYAIPGTKVAYDNVLSARDFAEMSDALRGTPYYKVIVDPMKRLVTGEEKTLFPLEMAVDSFVELLLYRWMRKLEPYERKMLLPIFGSRIDLMNIYILYRALVFYNMTPEETLNRLLPVRHKISLKFLREAVRIESYDAMAEMLKANFPEYAEVLIGTLKQDEPQLALERNIKRYIYTQAMRVFGRGSPGFHTAMSYFVIKEYEIEDLVHIIEDVRYGYDRRHAAVYLIKQILTGGETEWQ